VKVCGREPSFSRWSDGPLVAGGEDHVEIVQGERTGEVDGIVGAKGVSLGDASRESHQHVGQLMRSNWSSSDASALSPRHS